MKQINDNVKVYENFTSKKLIPFLKFEDNEESITETLNTLLQFTEADLYSGKYHVTKLQLLKLEEGMSKLALIEHKSVHFEKNKEALAVSINKIKTIVKKNEKSKQTSNSGEINWPKTSTGWVGYITSALLSIIILLFPWVAIIGAIIFIISLFN